MKKPIIGVVVLLAGTLAVLKYYSSREQAVAPPGTAARPPEQVGVALPAAATEYAAVSSESVYVPSNAVGNYESLSLPAEALALKGACEGGSPKEILEAHNRTWGYFTGRRSAIGTDKSKAIYDMLADYQACQAASRQDLTLCNELPGEAEKDGISVRMEDSPVRYCRDRAGLFLFVSYVLRKAPDQVNCLGYVADWDPADQAKVLASDFCAASAKGVEGFTTYARGRFSDFSEFERAIGVNKKACGAIQSCLSLNRLWEGVRTGNPGACPEDYAPHCAAQVRKSPAPCSEILSRMSRKYCGYHKELLKAGGGYAGMTAEEVKEELRKKAEAKAAAEAQRKQEDAVTKNINARVKKMMGKGE